MRWFFGRNYPIVLFIITLIVLGFSAIDVPHPEDFKLEHYMTVIFLFLLVVSYNHFRLSNISYTLIFIFLLLHILGAHYTYAEVPYNTWLQKWFDFNIDEYFGFERNHYDRLVHFSFGLLFFYPIRELFARIADTKGFWNLYLPLDVVMAFSMIYELIEYGVVLVYSDTGVDMTYLGTQGDIWDAHKDMFLATMGGLIAMLVVMIINIKLNKEFWKELKESFRIKKNKPLGEVEIETWFK